LRTGSFQPTQVVFQTTQNTQNLRSPSVLPLKVIHMCGLSNLTALQTATTLRYNSYDKLSRNAEGRLNHFW